MIPLSTYNLMVGMFFLLILYSLIDYKNKFYANIATAILALLMGLFLAASIYMGIIEYDDGTAISDLSLAILMLIPTLFIGVYAFFLGYDAFEEAKKAGEENGGFE